MTAIDPYRTLGSDAGCEPGRDQARLPPSRQALPPGLGRRPGARAGSWRSRRPTRRWSTSTAAAVAIGGRARGARAPSPPSAPWQADASRARATREAYRARTRRAGSTPGGAPGARRDARAATGRRVAPARPAVRRPVAARRRARARGRIDGRRHIGAGDRRGSTGGRSPAEPGSEGDDRLDELRRRRQGAVRPGLGGRDLVRRRERHVLDAQPEGVRRPAQARPRVPRPIETPGARRDGGGRDCRGRPTPAGAADDDRPDGGSPDAGTSGARRSERAGTGFDPAQRPAGEPTRTGGATRRRSASPPRRPRAPSDVGPSALAGDPVGRGIGWQLPGRARADAAGDARRADAGRAGSAVPPRPATAGTAAGAAGATVVRPVGAGSPPAFVRRRRSIRRRPQAWRSGDDSARTDHRRDRRLDPARDRLAVATEVMPACSGASLVCADPLKAGHLADPPADHRAPGRLPGSGSSPPTARRRSCSSGSWRRRCFIAIGGAQTPGRDRGRPAGRPRRGLAWRDRACAQWSGRPPAVAGPRVRCAR